MNLTEPAHQPVLYVAAHMRERDAEEIYNVRFDANPFHLMNDVMAQSSFAWVAWHDGKPAAVFGGAPRHPGVWQMFAFGTDDFNRIARSLTRFAQRDVIPRLFGELGAHRLQADSHIRHVDAHRWLKRLGAVEESVRKGYGRDGSDYLHFVVSKPGLTQP
jgi:hypothetical protein